MVSLQRPRCTTATTARGFEAPKTSTSLLFAKKAAHKGAFEPLNLQRSEDGMGKTPIPEPSRPLKPAGGLWVPREPCPWPAAEPREPPRAPARPGAEPEIKPVCITSSCLKYAARTNVSMEHRRAAARLEGALPGAETRVFLRSFSGFPSEERVTTAQQKPGEVGGGRTTRPLLLEGPVGPKLWEAKRKTCLWV